MNKEELTDLEELAALPGITEKEIAIALGLDPDEFKMRLDTDQPVKDAYNKGKLTAKIEFIKKVKQLSSQGSGPAQTLLLRIQNDEKVQELRNSYP